MNDQILKTNEQLLLCNNYMLLIYQRVPYKSTKHGSANFELEVRIFYTHHTLTETVEMHTK